MAEYGMTFARSARKELENLDAALVSRIFPKIKALAVEPRPAGCRKLQGEKHLWRIRIGDYRVIYAIDDQHQVVDVTAVRHRSAAYR
jgi:mRNA interferase RelE/StbE